MHLKSLNLKGFKSFADRSVLGFEPGITAIVGPNGSGKSNISDAVLWVLGERNAKNLRGQAMEDVVFAGSSARKPVGVAEVDLVLDNSDATLPIEFNEVAITRRMYRSGESEYLINGASARRMDVLDILHDTGLGTGTHSIISQGSLDSILQSKPEDRRSLIEEAAGVLKHKQRKQKSERKLAQMDNHLMRVKDVVAEIERQLKPLERKAKRAQAYQGVAAELAELSLALAVDDLRVLKEKWRVASESEASLTGQLEQMKQKIAEVEQRVQKLQEDIQARSENAGDIAKRFRQAQSIIERLDSATMLLHEKKRSAQTYEEELFISLEENLVKQKQAALAFEQAQKQLEETSAERGNSEEQVEKLVSQQSVLLQKKSELEAALSKEAERQRRCTREIETARLAQSENNELLSNSRAHEKLISGHTKELEVQIEHAKLDLDKSIATVSETEGKLESLKKQEQEAREKVAQAFSTREELRVELEALQDGIAVLAAEIKGLEERERASEATSPALDWTITHQEDFKGDFTLLSHVVKAPEGYEQLVEWLLSSDIRSLLVDDVSVVQDIAEALYKTDETGELVLFPMQDKRTTNELPSSLPHATLLVSLMECADTYRPALTALLGDVYVCSSSHDAIAAHEADTNNARFVTKEGFMIWPSGKVSLGLGKEEEEGILARHRRLLALRKEHETSKSQFDTASSQKEDADKTLQSAQSESLQLSQELAQLQGSYSSAQDEQKRAEEKLSALNRELADLAQQRKEAQEILSKAQPTLQELENAIKTHSSELEEAKNKAFALRQELTPLAQEVGEIEKNLTQARLQVATFTERENYAKRMVDSNEQEAKNLVAQYASAQESLARKRIAKERIVPLLETLDDLSRSAKRWGHDLEEATADAEHFSSGLHGEMTAARTEARTVQNAYDELNEKLSDARVEKGRLEVQVEAAIATIVEECKTPLETALEIPELESRSEVEDSVFKLRRKIANMGTINPDAAMEYEELKKRYDYMAIQLDDMTQARHALAKIVRVIDARMKDDFITTFNQVNEYFKEIFTVLFPGGSAELSLVDPDDPETTGVEVTAQPRGKRITKMTLMSGGEKSLTALALLFAVYRIRTTPFYILDEVEAALDDTNLRRLCAYFNSLRESTQLILITHQRRTMEMADVLYGISMQADGVTRVVSQKLDRALQYAEG